MRPEASVFLSSWWFSLQNVFTSIVILASLKSLSTSCVCGSYLQGGAICFTIDKLPDVLTGLQQPP